MALPKQVQMQIDDMAAYDKSLQEQAAAPLQTTEEVPPAVNDVAEPIEVAQAEFKEVAPPAEETKLAEPWEQRYSTLKGMYDAEVPRLHAQTREMTRTLQTLETEIAELKKPKPEVVAPESAVTDKDKEVFGEDLIDLQRRVVREMVSPLQDKLAAVEKENAELRATVGQTGTQVAAYTFEQQLATKVPNFAAINADPRWVEWLNETDPLLRAPRRNLAQAAFEQGDVDAISAYVGLFEKSVAPAAVAKVPKVDKELQAQISPSRSNSASTPHEGNEDTRTYTASEASSLWDKVAQLNRTGKYDEASKLDTTLTQAYQTGRVR